MCDVEENGGTDMRNVVYIREIYKKNFANILFLTMKIAVVTKYPAPRRSWRWRPGRCRPRLSHYKELLNHSLSEPEPRPYQGHTIPENAAPRTVVVKLVNQFNMRIHRILVNYDSVKVGLLLRTGRVTFSSD